MHVITIINNNNVIYQKKYYEVLVGEKTFYF